LKKEMKKFTAMFAIAALMLVASPVSAFFGGSDVEVKVYNDAYVKNVIDTKADTGDNSSQGGDARSKARASGWFSDANSTARGGNGGAVDTGDAISTTYVENVVNDNDVSVRAS
jgi:hypothetical protein